MKIRYTGFFLILVSIIWVVACKEKPKEIPTNNIPITGNPTIDAVSQKIAESPDDPSLYAARAELFYENEGYDEAIADITKALSIDSTNVNYCHFLADAYLDYFQSRQALKTMEYAAELFPNRIPTLLKLSEFQLILKKNQESLQTIDRILQSDPQNAEAYFMMGMNFKETGDTARAINSFQTAVENDPDLLDGWINLGQLFSELENPIAIRYFDNAVRVAPDNIPALHAKAYYLQETGDLAGAIDLFKNISSLNPQYEEAYFNAGLLYLDLDSIEQAYRQFDFTVKFSPTHIRAYYYRGLSSEMRGDIVSAKSNYEQALRMAPGYEKAEEGLERLKEVQ